jgi:hypothetical protein
MLGLDWIGLEFELHYLVPSFFLFFDGLLQILLCACMGINGMASARIAVGEVDGS